MPSPEPQTVIVKDHAFHQPATPFVVILGGEVIFDFQESHHTVVTTEAVNADAIAINNGGGPHDAVPSGQKCSVTINGTPGGVIRYECGIHGDSMSGEIHLACSLPD